MTVPTLLRMICFLASRTISINWINRGIGLDEQGNLAGAINAFRKATEEDVLSEKAWQNLGVALMRKGSREHSSSPLMQSAEAFHKATALGTDARENLALLKKKLVKMFPTACTNTRGRLFKVCQRIDRDLASIKRTPDESCKSEIDREKSLSQLECKERVTIKVTAKEREEGFLSSWTLRKLAQGFEDCGVVVIKGVYKDELVTRLIAAQNNHFNHWMETFSEINSTTYDMRSEGRYEIMLPMEPPFTNEAFLRAPLLYPLLQRLLGTAMEIDTFSSLILFPHTPKMHWHRDTDFLFSKEKKLDQPAHGIVVFVPMVNISPDMGPTEFVLKSHIPCSEAQLKGYVIEDTVQSLCPWARSRFKATAGIGDAILLDTRIFHRGTGNVSNKHRPMLKVSYVKDFWFDRVNYNSQHTRRFEDITSKLRKLLTRVDTRAYIRNLEAVLKENGLEADKSRLNFNSHDYSIITD